MRYLLSLLLILLLAGCEPSEEPVSPAEALKLGRNLDTSIQAGDGAVLRSLFDEELLARRTARLAGMRFNTGVQRGIVEGLKKNGFTRAVLSDVENGGSYHLVRVYEKEGKQHMIFRLYGSDGLNYHDFTLAKREGRVRASDVYVLLTGENLSQTFADLLKTLNENSNAAPASDLNRVQQLYASGQYAAARRSLDSLPASMRANRTFQILNLSVTSHLDSNAYASALATFQQRFGNDPSAQFALFDHYFNRGEYARTHRIIDDIDKMMQDPFLNFFHALIYKQSGDTTAAISALERMKPTVPDFEDGALELLALYVARGEVAKGNAAIREYKANPKYKQAYLSYIRYKYAAQADRFTW